LRPSAAFTLLELLLAFAITALLMTLLTAVLAGTLKTATAVETSADVSQEGRALLQLIASDISSALWEGEGIESFLGEDSLEGGTPADSLHLATTASPLLSGGTPCEVSYTIRERAGRKELLRREAFPVDRRISAGGTVALISSSVLSLNFSYFDGQTWRDSWSAESEGALPMAVRVEFLLSEAGGDNLKPFAAVVPVISGGSRQEEK